MSIRVVDKSECNTRTILQYTGIKWDAFIGLDPSRPNLKNGGASIGVGVLLENIRYIKVDNVYIVTSRAQ